jgi:hypothetical protein
LVEVLRIEDPEQVGHLLLGGELGAEHHIDPGLAQLPGAAPLWVSMMVISVLLASLANARRSSALDGGQWETTAGMASAVGLVLDCGEDVAAAP